MSRAQRIGILTGGGDVPGLNSVIKSVVYSTSVSGYDVLGIRRGWMGLTHLQQGTEFDAAYIRPLNRANTRGIDRTGGTTLHTSRINPSKMRRATVPQHFGKEKLQPLEIADGVYDFTTVVLDNIAHLGLDYLIVIGGDDTLSFAKALEGQGVRIIGIPKTMDNDVQGTEYCIGFSTAITRAKELITRQRTTLGSHERIGIFRIFGRDSGFTALYTAYVTSGRCLIPEVEFDLEHLIEILLEDKRNNPSRYAFVIASEGAVWQGGSLAEYGEADAYGHKKKADIGHARRPGCPRPGGGDYPGKPRRGSDPRGDSWAPGGCARRQVYARAFAGSEVWPAQAGCSHDVQRRPLPAELRRQDGFPTAALPRHLCLRRSGSL